MPELTDLLTLTALKEYWQHSADMAFIKDINGVYVVVSRQFASMAGWNDPADIAGKTDFDVFDDKELAKRYVDDDARLLSSGISLENYIEPICGTNGRPRYSLTSKFILKNAEGEAIGIYGIGRDITVEYEAKQIYENELKSLFELPEDAPAAVLFDITSWRVVDARYRKDASHVVSRYSQIDSYFSNAADSVVNNDEVRCFFTGLSQEALQRLYNSGRQNISFEYLRRFSDETEHWVRDDLHFLLDPVNGNLSLIIILHDIDASKRAYSALLQAAQRDPMTKLLNRGVMMAQIADYLAGEGRDGVHALFIIDLDNFKQINDSFGHQYGDSMLMDVAAAIGSVFRQADIIGRLGSDEFMALMKNAASRQTVCRKASDLISALQFSSRNSKVALDLTSSVGITVFRAGERDFETLYKEADMALYQSKRDGKNRYSIFDFSTHSANSEPGYSEAGSVDTVHLRTLMEYMDGGVILAEVTDTMRITYVSPSIYRTFPFIEENAGGPYYGLRDAVLPEDLPKLSAALMRTAQSHHILDHSFRISSTRDTSWCHIRAKRLPSDSDGTNRLIAVITDVSFLKRTEEHLRLTEARYRNAIDQTQAMLWEVDIPTRRLILTGPAWAKFGYSQSVYENIPDAFLDARPELSGSAAELRRMFGDIAACRPSSNYYMNAFDTAGEEVWLRAHYRLLQDENNQSRCALGVTVPVPHINAQMRRFNQGAALVDLIRDSLFGYFSANLTQNIIEHAEVNDDPRCTALIGMPFGDFQSSCVSQAVCPDDFSRFMQFASRESLLQMYANGESWAAVDYRRICPGGALRFVSLFIKIVAHPVSGDVYAYAYLKDDDDRRRRALTFGAPLHYSDTLLLYTPDSMAAFSRHILSTCSPCELAAISVIEFMGLDKPNSPLTDSVARYCDRICRIVTGGSAIIGRLDEKRIVFLRLGVSGSEHQHQRVSSTVAMLKKLLIPAYPEFSLNIISGFAVSKVADSTYDALLRKALVACRAAAQTLGDSTVAYADFRMDTPAPDSSETLADRFDQLELRYQQQADMLRISENDFLTGVLGKRAFYRRVRQILDADPDGEYVIVRFDINRFKVFNDVRGMAAGDKLLCDIGAKMQAASGRSLLCARLDADHFALLSQDDPASVSRSVNMLSQWLATYSPDFRITATVGVYRISDPSIDVSLMCDRALLALHAAKSGFDTNIAYYDAALRDRLLDEQQLVSDMDAAIESGQFVLYYQPIVNYETGALAGAEALVRWQHPTRGLLTPGAFIPLFEKNALITRLDQFVWERCCMQLSDWRKKYPQAANIAISLNVSRLDIYDAKLTAFLCALIQKYDLPPSAIKLEITESAYMENPQQLMDTVRELQSAGFAVEMDDFGSGFSSLNTLKDVEVDVLKLDMNFLSNCTNSARGGNILSSVIRMAHWLKLPLVAEGIESRFQADYLKSLGCVYMQGYYFDRPLPAEDFAGLLTLSVCSLADKYLNVSVDGMAAFWDPSAQMALLFNSFVGGAAIMEYKGGALEALRVNDNYYKTLGTTREAYVDIQSNVLALFDDENRMRLIAEITRAITTGEECGCELQTLPGVGGVKNRWTSSRIRLLAKNGDRAILYVSVSDITDRKLMELEQAAETERGQLLMQTTGISFFDYDVASDVFSCRLFLAGKGMTKQIVHNYHHFLSTSNVVDPDGVKTILGVIDNLGEPPCSGEFDYRASLWQAGMRWCHARYVGLADDSGRIYRIVGQIDDIQELRERAAIAESIRQRLKNVAPQYSFNDDVVNQIFALFYDAVDIADAISTTLSLLGEHYDLSRAYIFEDSPSHSYASNTFEWCAQGINAERDKLQNVTYDSVGGRDDYLSRFSNGTVFYCEDVSTLPGGLRSTLEAQGIRSVLQYAIRDHGVFTGMVGFDECRTTRAWSDSQVGTLLFVSRIIGSFLQRLRQSDSAAFSADFRATLDNSASYVYIIDPDTFEVIWSNKAIVSHSGKSFIGAVCYRDFAGLDSPCACCPARHFADPSISRSAEIRRFDGMTLLSNASPLRWNGRDMVMMNCIDVSEAKRAEQALMTERQKTAMLLSAANLLLWTYDIDADTITPSDTFGNIYRTGEPIEGGYREIIARGIVAPESADEYIALHQRLIAGDASSSAVIRFNPEKCAVEQLHITYSTVSDPVSGKPKIGVAIGRCPDVLQ